MASSFFVGNTKHVGITLAQRTDCREMEVAAYCDGSHIGETEAWSSVLEGRDVESGCVEDEGGSAYFLRRHDSTSAERWGILRSLMMIDEENMVDKNVTVYCDNSSAVKEAIGLSKSDHEVTRRIRTMLQRIKD